MRCIFDADSETVKHPHDRVNLKLPVAGLGLTWINAATFGATVYEKGPYEENIYEEHIFFVRPLLEHDGVREGALRRKYIRRTYICRKAPSRTWRVREGALRARMCALVTFKFSRVTN